MTAEQEGSPGDADRRRLLLTELAFAPGGDPRVAAEAAAALRELDAEKRLEGAAPTADSPDGQDDPPPPEPHGAEQATPHRTRRRALLWIGGALAVLLVAGVAIQGATSATHRAAESEPVASDPSSSSRASVLSAALNRVEVPTDALPEAIRGEVDLGSSRVVYDEDPSLAATRDRWRLWVGYGVDTSQVCFVASYDNVGDAVTCVPKERALLDRVVLVSTLPGRRFEMLANGGAIAVQVD